MRRPSTRRPANDSSPPAPDTLRVTALRLLGRRDYSRHELEHRLLDRGYEPDDVGKVVESLERDGTLNDTRVAEAHVRTASRIKARGRHRIRRELEARGISPAIADAALKALPDADESNSIGRLLDRKIKSSTLSPEDRRRLVQQLLRRGFPAPLITAALRRRGRTSED